MRILLLLPFLLSVALADIFIKQDSTTTTTNDYKEGAEYKKYDITRAPLIIQGKTYQVLWKLHSKKSSGKPGNKKSGWKLVAIIGEKGNFTVNIDKENIYEYKEGFSYSNGHILSYGNKLWRLNCDTTLTADKPQTNCQWQVIGLISKGSDIIQKGSASKKKLTKTESTKLVKTKNK